MPSNEARRLDELFQRSRLDPAGAGPAAPGTLPPRPPAVLSTWWARIVIGTDVGQVLDVACGGDGAPYGFYLDEIGPDFEPIYPSRTRSAANAYIPAVGINRATAPWWAPVPAGSIVEIVTCKKLGYDPVHYFCQPVLPWLAEITEVSGPWYESIGCRWLALYTEGDRPPYTFGVELACASWPMPYPWLPYPFPKVGDAISVILRAGDYQDLTPRIRLLEGAIGAKQHDVLTDPTENDGRGEVFAGP